MRTASLLKTRTDSRGTDQAEEGSPYGFQGLLLLEERENVHKYKKGGDGLSLYTNHPQCMIYLSKQKCSSAKYFEYFTEFAISVKSLPFTSYLLQISAKLKSAKKRY